MTIAGPVRSWAIHVTQPVTRSMRRKGCLAYDSEHPLTGPPAALSATANAGVLAASALAAAAHAGAGVVAAPSQVL